MFDPTTFTGVHTDLSIIGIIAGFIVIAGLIGGRISSLWTEIYLATAVLTSATGFGFPFTKFLPSHGVGVISLAVLAIALLALYVFKLSGIWRAVYAATAVIGVYFLVFVAIAQSFGKIPALHQLAPTMSEPPFAIAQGVNLLIFAVLGIASIRSLRSAPLAA